MDLQNFAPRKYIAKMGNLSSKSGAKMVIKCHICTDMNLHGVVRQGVSLTMYFSPGGFTPQFAHSCNMFAREQISVQIHFFVHVRRVEFQSIYARRQKISRLGEGQYFVVFSRDTSK